MSHTIEPLQTGDFGVANCINTGIFGNGDKLFFTEQQRFRTDRFGLIIGLQSVQERVLKPVFDFEFHHRNDIHTAQAPRLPTSPTIRLALICSAS